MLDTGKDAIIEAALNAQETKSGKFMDIGPEYAAVGTAVLIVTVPPIT